MVVAFAAPNDIVLGIQIALDTVLPCLVAATALLQRVSSLPTLTSASSTARSSDESRPDVCEPFARPTDLSRRGMGLADAKTLAYISISLFEIFSSSVRLFLGVQSTASLAALLVQIVAWSLAALPVVRRSSRGPPYFLFALFAIGALRSLFSLLAAVLSSTIGDRHDQLLNVLHLSAYLLGLLLSLDTHLGFMSDDGTGPEVAWDEKATFGQWLSVSWLKPVLDLARERSLEEFDIGRLSGENQARPLSESFLSTYTDKTVLRRIVVANRHDLVLFALTTMTEGALLCAQPVLLRYILTAVEVSSDATSRVNVRDAYLYTFIAFALLVVRAHVGVLNEFLQRRFIVRSRAQVTSIVYNKALVRINMADIPATAREGKDADEGPASADMGKLVSLLSVDVDRVEFLPLIITSTCRTPLNIIIAGAFLYSILGYSAFVGYIMFFVVTPFTTWITKRMISRIDLVMKLRDLRVQAVAEAFQSIRFIKFSGWETRWLARIMNLRSNELAAMWRFQVLQAIFQLTWEFVPIAISCINLAWYTTVAGHQLTIATAFPAILALSQLTSEVNSAPDGFNYYAMLITALARIDEFLAEDEVPEWVSSLKTSHRATSGGKVGAVNATFTWPATPKGVQDDHFTLRDINIQFPPGQLSVIAGPTGSGKSSLLFALLGEMPCTAGLVLMPKDSWLIDPVTGLSQSVSFCSQHPWLEPKTIRENILFGSSYEPERYDEVLQACALKPDLAQLQHGDKTNVGHNGITLSGGQKARLALARSVYSRTQIVLLDDVLSAADVHTADTLVQQCLFGPLMTGRTVILVTHHISSVISGAALVVKMESGRIVGSESGREAVNLSVRAKSYPIYLEDQLQDSKTNDVLNLRPKNIDTNESLVEDEAKAEGSVRWNVYSAYFEAASYWIGGLFLISLLLQQAGALAEKIWIRVWTEAYDQPVGWHGVFGFGSASQSVRPYVLFYLGIQLTSALVLAATMFPAVLSSLRASRILFRDMLDAVLRSPTRFFDRTPHGRLLNRFSRDITDADTGIMHRIQNVSISAISFVVSLGVIVYAAPPFIVPLIILAWLHVYVARSYVAASRDLVRLQAITLSPLITQFGVTLEGLTTIRAFGSEARVMAAMFHILDRHNWTLYYHAACDVWLRYRFDLLGAFTFAISAVLVLYTGTTPGLAAIVLVQAEAIITGVYFGIMEYVRLENAMNSVARISEFISLPPEPPRHVPNLPAAWPILSDGITFEHVVLRYSYDAEPVLRGVSFHIKAGEKIGIVGRTGSGKSTLAMALFRFMDPETGRILVGGRDIRTVGVEDLRQQLTLVPQDVTLHNGTLRDNLDPFNEQTDAECIKALRSVSLIEDAAGSDGGSAGHITRVNLESPVTNGGANWSAGQRQLIATARALLRKARIIVLDESTASVDLETDQRIQRTMREQFEGCTLLTIAHRLDSIIDYDRVMVLESGRLVEFESPAALLATENGVFRGLCEQTGRLAEFERSARLVA